MNRIYKILLGLLSLSAANTFAMDLPTDDQTPLLEIILRKDHSRLGPYLRTVSPLDLAAKIKAIIPMIIERPDASEYDEVMSTFFDLPGMESIESLDGNNFTSRALEKGMPRTLQIFLTKFSTTYRNRINYLVNYFAHHESIDEHTLKTVELVFANMQKKYFLNLDWMVLLSDERLARIFFTRLDGFQCFPGKDWQQIFASFQDDDFLKKFISQGKQSIRDHYNKIEKIIADKNVVEFKAYLNTLAQVDLKADIKSICTKALNNWHSLEQDEMAIILFKLMDELSADDLHDYLQTALLNRENQEVAEMLLSRASKDDLDRIGLRNLILSYNFSPTNNQIKNISFMCEKATKAQVREAWPFQMDDEIRLMLLARLDDGVNKFFTTDDDWRMIFDYIKKTPQRLEKHFPIFLRNLNQKALIEFYKRLLSFEKNHDVIDFCLQKVDRQIFFEAKLNFYNLVSNRFLKNEDKHRLLKFLFAKFSDILTPEQLGGISFIKYYYSTYKLVVDPTIWQRSIEILERPPFADNDELSILKIEKKLDDQMHARLKIKERTVLVSNVAAIKASQSALSNFIAKNYSAYNLNTVKSSEEQVELALHDRSMASAIAHEIIGAKIFGLSCSAQNSTVVIKFLIQFGAKNEAKDFELMLPRLERYLAVKTPAASLSKNLDNSLHALPSYYGNPEREIERTPIYRPKKTSTVVAPNINKKIMVASTDKKDEKKKPANAKKTHSSNKVQKSELQKSNPKESLATKIPKLPKLEEKKQAPHQPKYMDEKPLSGALPKKIATTTYNPQISPIVFEASKKEISPQQQTLVSLLRFAHTKLGEALEHGDNQHKFFASYAPLLMLCDAFGQYERQTNPSINIVNPNQSLNEMSKLKNLRDEKLKKLPLYFNDAQAQQSFIALAKNIFNEFSIAIDALEQHIKNPEIMLSFSNHWQRINEQFSLILQDAETDMGPARSGLADLYIQEVDKNSWKAMGLLAMAGALCEPEHFLPFAGSLLHRARLLRDFFAHPQGSADDFKKSLNNHNKKIRKAIKQPSLA